MIHSFIIQFLFDESSLWESSQNKKQARFAVNNYHVKAATNEQVSVWQLWVKCWRVTHHNPMENLLNNWGIYLLFYIELFLWILSKNVSDYFFD